MTDKKLMDLAKFAAHTALKAGAKDARSVVSRSREVDVEWRDGALVAATIRSTRGGPLHVRAGERTWRFATRPGQTIRVEP